MIFFVIERYDDKFRKTLVSNVPGIEPVLKVLLQEEGNALDQASKSLSKASQKVSDITTTVTGYFGKTTEEPKSNAFPIKSKLFDFFINTE